MEKKLYNFIVAHKNVRKTVQVIGTWFPLLLGLLFAVFGVFLILQKEFGTALHYAIPALLLHGMVGSLRRRLNHPRPFECWGVSPLLPHSPGQAFPSRHSADGAILAMAVLWQSTGAGCAALFLCFAIAFSRVLCGLHSFWDVAVGLAMGLSVGYVAYFLI